MDQPQYTTLTDASSQFPTLAMHEASATCGCFWSPSSLPLWRHRHNHGCAPCAAAIRHCAASVHCALQRIGAVPAGLEPYKRQSYLTYPARRAAIAPVRSLCPRRSNNSLLMESRRCSARGPVVLAKNLVRPVVVATYYIREPNRVLLSWMIAFDRFY